MQPRFTLILSCLALLAGISISTAQAATISWQPIEAEHIAQRGTRHIVPQKFEAFQTDLEAMANVLNAAPTEISNGRRTAGLIIPIPMPNGATELFEVWDAPIMAPALADRYPQIRTYRGRGIDDRTATIRFDQTQKGFHAQIIRASGTVYIDPYSTEQPDICISYHKRDYLPQNAFECLVDDTDHELNNRSHRNMRSAPVGEQLRIYRLALACTGEYAQFHGGNVPDVLAAFVTSINRVNGIYEREISVRLELIANTDQLIFLDASTDPYTNNSGGTMLGQNQSTVTTIIGNANYDIGHVFSTGGGGIASLGSVCSNQNKARGVTGLGSPIGDAFDVDYVAHEMGHQFGGNHTFNSNAGSCSGNRVGSVAFEPGSGSTIMAYAGLCGSHNIASNSDDYFHTASFDEIRDYITIDDGNNCPQIGITGNTDPIPIADPNNQPYTIPAETPFWLTGTGSDAEGDSITFCWEQMDLGPAGNPDLPQGDAPLFRSFDPVSTPTRFFPRPFDVANGIQTKGELLPTTSRTLTFRLTARDNLGGVRYDGREIDVTDQAGPFLVTEPNVATTYNAGQHIVVEWDRANTHLSPVSCGWVNIRFSVDGGMTFPYELLSWTANDGSALVALPNVETTEGRVKVEAADHIFYDIDDEDLTLQRVAIDGGVPNIVTPINNVIDDAQNTVRVWLHNYGATPINNFDVALKKNGTTIATEPFSGTIQAGDSAWYEFGQQLGVLGGSIVEICVEMVGVANDGDPNNNQRCKTYNVALGMNEQPRMVTRVFPVPASNELMLELNTFSGSTQISATDATGKIVLAQRAAQPVNGRAVVDVTSLSNGVYFYHIEADGQTETGRFVVVR